MRVLLTFIALLIGLRIYYWMAVKQGRRQATEEIGATFAKQLHTYKSMADDLLRRSPQQAELHLHFGDEVVDCKSTMETAQFSQALKGVIDHLKPFEETHPDI